MKWSNSDIMYMSAKYGIHGDLQTALNDKECVLVIMKANQIRTGMDAVLRAIDPDSVIYVKRHDSLIKTTEGIIKFVSNINAARGYDRHTTTAVDWRFE